MTPVIQSHVKKRSSHLSRQFWYQNKAKIQLFSEYNIRYLYLASFINGNAIYAALKFGAEDPPQNLHGYMAATPTVTPSASYQQDLNIIKYVRFNDYVPKITRR